MGTHVLAVDFFVGVVEVVFNLSAFNTFIEVFVNGHMIQHFVVVVEFGRDNRFVVLVI